MDRQKVIDYWAQFFTDLFVGTLKNLFLFGTSGLLLSIASLLIFKSVFLDVVDWNIWAETGLLVLSVFWYCGLGVALALLACVIHTTGKNWRKWSEGYRDCST